jgi:hypothetical protein
MCHAQQHHHIVVAGATRHPSKSWSDTLWYLPTKAAATHVYVVRAQEWCPQESLATVNE